ncbi:hypothetical protein R1T16_11590 [Flavobacterium sp. DG1-102-2]|uniref:hypothetical protein n=1 Tax=Flavobacterium sp. DG1-102-2 TaxID=3081663 RepID=UPI00294949A8|nr:hypothetical protein [Flavobacterium sp. DG1-102-2]MDV6169069.1 hypothetical protein [Flavobacterium sp. DG1-102-2]
MPKFDKFSLKCTYSWTEADKAKIEGDITNDDIIDRNNGYQVLDLINYFFEMSGFMTTDAFNRLEQLIRKELPEDLKTRREIKAWLTKNWNKRL